MSRIEEIVCTRINVRLAERLLALRRAGGKIAATQQALAADLGTAREVVGRTLKAFERSGWVKLSRGGAETVNRRPCDRFATRSVLVAGTCTRQARMSSPMSATVSAKLTARKAQKGD